MRIRELNGDAGGFGWPVVNRLPRITAAAGPSAPTSPGNTAALEHSGRAIVVRYTAARPWKVATWSVSGQKDGDVVCGERCHGERVEHLVEAEPAR